jgi:hypothetical protein
MNRCLMDGCSMEALVVMQRRRDADESWGLTCAQDFLLKGEGIYYLITIRSLLLAKIKENLNIQEGRVCVLRYYPFNRRLPEVDGHL